VQEVPNAEVEAPQVELPPPAPLVPDEPPKAEYTKIDQETELKMLDGMYGDYTAKRMVEMVEAQKDVIDLSQLLTWEETNKNRKTVVKAIKKAMPA
jgi:hypothetical protein